MYCDTKDLCLDEEYQAVKIYYAHAMCIYGTDDEMEEINHIKSIFPDHEIVNPGTYANNPEKRRDGMNYCKTLVSGCDILVFSRLYGKITAGVGIEINHALDENKKVFELKNGKVKQVKKPVRYISREGTIALYGKYRMKNGGFGLSALFSNLRIRT